MRNNKGITLVALIITIAVMIILAGVSINVTSDMQEQMKFQAFKTQLDILQTEVIDNYENAQIVTENMKAKDAFVTYTPEELETKGFTKPDQDAYINWSTRQVKMIYKGQEYFSDKYNVQSNVTNKSNTDFDIDISYQENRYKVKVQPKENTARLEVAYRVKAEGGQEENSWILANGLEFEYVNYGIYEVRLKDKNGKETIKTINQTLQTVSSNESIATLDGTLGEKLVNYKIYGKSVQNGTPKPDNPVEIQSLGDSGSFDVVTIGNNLLNANMISGYYNRIDGTIVEENSDIYKSTNMIKLPAGTYTVSSNNNIGIVRLLKKDIELIYSEFNGYKELPYTFTLTETCEIGFSFRDATSNTTQWTYGDNTMQLEIQVELNDIATSYQPFTQTKYTINIDEPLRSLPDGTNDYIEFSSEKIVRSIGNYTYNGSEKWEEYEGTEEDLITWYYVKNFDTIYPKSNGFSRLLSTHFKGGAIRTENSINYGNPNMFFSISRKIVDTIPKLKDWLSNNPVQVIYDLQETEEKEIDMQNVLTNKGTTHIYVEDETIGLVSCEFTYIKTEIL